MYWQHDQTTIVLGDLRASMHNHAEDSKVRDGELLFKIQSPLDWSKIASQRMQNPSPALAKGSKPDIPIITPYNIKPLKAIDGTLSHVHGNKEDETEAGHDSLDVPDKDNMDDHDKGKVEAYVGERVGAP